MSDHAAAVLHLSRRRLSGLCGVLVAIGAGRLPARCVSRARGKLPLEGITGARRRAGLAAADARQRLDDQRMVRGRAGRDPHRGRRARRPADRSDAPPRRPRPSARAFSVPARGGRRPRGRSARRRRAAPAPSATLTDAGENCLFFIAAQQWFRVEARVALAADEAVEIDAAEARQSRTRPRKAHARLAARMGSQRDRRRAARPGL